MDCEYIMCANSTLFTTYKHSICEYSTGINVSFSGSPKDNFISGAPECAGVGSAADHPMNFTDARDLLTRDH